MSDLEASARAAIDAAHARGPEQIEGRPAEAVYADRIEAWIRELVDDPSPALRLSSRGQHLERWAIPRNEFPEGRGGYLRWRSAVHRRQGQRARELLIGVGCEPVLTERVAQLVSKTTPKGDPEAQALEDAACLVFLEWELPEFQREHDRTKVIDILRKTWKKMSPKGRDLAHGLTLPPETQELVRLALA
jgi:tRNAThr (cytosine32-N3)-methyltransferase